MPLVQDKRALQQWPERGRCGYGSVAVTKNRHQCPKL